MFAFGVPLRFHDLRDVTLFAGQADPTDASRFTIRYEVTAEVQSKPAIETVETGVVDGRLMDGGAWVQLTVRDGAVKETRFRRNTKLDREGLVFR